MSTTAESVPSTTAPVVGEQLNQEQIVERYNRLRQEQSTVMSRIADLETESHEHELVAEELRPLNADRSCHRLVGGALIERTVGEVLPEIEANLAAIREVLGQLNKGLAEKDKQLESFMTTYNLRRQGSGGSASASSGAAGDAGSRGVLA